MSGIGLSAPAAVRHGSAVHREGVFWPSGLLSRAAFDTKGSYDYDLKGSRGLVDFFQLRAARALTGLSQAEVAEAAGVSVPTLKRAEAEGPIKVADETIAAIAKALEKAGVEFIPENGGGAGVRLAKRGKRLK
jgi:DNA-binding XRE family transcriptional regulator